MTTAYPGAPLGHVGRPDPKTPALSNEADIETADIRPERIETEHIAIRAHLKDLEALCKGMDRVMHGQYARGRLLEARGLCHRAQKALASDDTSVGVLRHLRASMNAAVREIRKLRNTHSQTP